MAYTYKKEDESKEFDVLPEGDYECYIEKMIEGVTPSGSKYIRVQLRVRDDVEQEGKNRVISDFLRYDDTLKQYNPKKINRLLYTQDVAENTRFDTEEDVINFLSGCNLIAHVKVGEWQGKQTNNVYYYKKTKNPTDAKFSSGSKAETHIIDDDDDMPF